MPIVTQYATSCHVYYHSVQFYRFNLNVSLICPLDFEAALTNVFYIIKLSNIMCNVTGGVMEKTCSCLSPDSTKLFSVSQLIVLVLQTVTSPFWFTLS